MKLKRTQEPEMVAPLPAVGGAERTDSFTPRAETAGSAAGAAVALVCSLLALALVGATAWLIYQNLELIQNV